MTISALLQLLRRGARAEGGVMGLEVAEFFGKQHKNVLRDIDVLISHSPNLGGGVSSSLFTEAKVHHPTVSGRFDRTFDMTRDNSGIVVMPPRRRLWRWPCMKPDDSKLTRQAAAQLAGVATVTLDRWLRQPGGPPWEKFRRRVRIPATEFKLWLAAQVQPRGGAQ